eukprot:TRINITY_DN114391_c0_g1_i1.p1 TRINITY_DN114391_c0_g1~~TRINITY_DN114391_c0_g1_i1.p1  ORF type:complete len:195 (+),score=63.52 TRINITY_DN114391_c0_g1_i1:97-681(+)
MVGVNLPVLSMPHTLPEERVRLLRRVEHTANARTEARCIGAMNFANRGRSKEKMLAETSAAKKSYLADKDDRIQRWVSKTEGHPFQMDLWAEDEDLYKANQRNMAKMRYKEGLAKRRAHEAHGAILSRAYSETDVLNEVRIEKRSMLQHEKVLKALQDVSKKNDRAAKVFQDRRDAEMLKQKKMLYEAMKGKTM